jgi:hypothetical protein
MQHFSLGCDLDLKSWGREGSNTGYEWYPCDEYILHILWLRVNCILYQLCLYHGYYDSTVAFEPQLQHWILGTYITTEDVWLDYSSVWFKHSKQWMLYCNIPHDGMYVIRIVRMLMECEIKYTDLQNIRAVEYSMRQPSPSQPIQFMITPR